MQFLRLMGVSSDSSSLILVGGEGKQFRLTVDEALRSAVRSARVSPATQAATLALPPREIQARLRAGATAEEVARDAGVPADKVRRYEVPILAERAHIADRARQALIRRPAGGAPTAGAQILGELVARRADEDDYEAESVGWDAWRREDGRWTVQITLPADPNRPMRWTFEPPTRAASPANDEARELLAERSARPEPMSAKVHSLSAARDEPRKVEPRKPELRQTDKQLDLDDEASSEQIELPMRQAVGESRRSGRRPAVPAWDDILLGARRSD